MTQELALETNATNTDYARIERAILFLEQNFKRQPELHEIARHVHLSEFHFQRLFSTWAGISPKRFLQLLTIEHSKKLLAQSESVLDASLSAGLSGPSRLHDLFVSIEAVSPGEFKSRGENLEIRYGFHDTPFGECLIGATQRGICELSFSVDREHALNELRQTWPNAKLLHSTSETAPFVERIFGGSRSSTEPLKVFCRGTNFQAKVWNALLRIPSGSVVSYETLARSIGCPKSSRAVGSAVGQNQLAYLIPCHRVIQKVGLTGNYRWGAARKKAILAWESAQASGSEEP